MQNTKPVKPPAPYIGGKRLLAARIIKRINTIPHTTYVEPFCGMGGVFFRRDTKPPCEVINDLNGEVANFFRILQRHYHTFMDELQFRLTSREEFERLKKCDPTTLTDIERAVRFFYLQKTAFGGKVTGQNFGVSFTASARFDTTKIKPILEAIYERLSSVTIENLSYENCIKKYDRPSTLFYLDPPYWGSEDCYGNRLFSRADFENLAQLLSGIKGRFILSLNDTPEILKIFEAFHIETVPVSYSVAKGNRKQSKEVIIRNS